MTASKKRLQKWLKEIRKIGRGDPTPDGVFVIETNGVVSSDQDGNPVSPLDPDWNNPEAVAQRRSSSDEEPK